MIVAITGLCVARRKWWQLSPRMGSAGAGKSTVANRLVAKHGFTELALAAPMKRFLADLFDWPLSMLNGETAGKNVGDPRYPRPDGTLLSPREAMILLATEWGRNCYPTIWVEYAIRKATELERVVMSDVRFRNELEQLKAAGAITVRVKRPVKELFVKTTHPSENELNEIPDLDFDVVVNGPEHGVTELETLVDRMMRRLGRDYDHQVHRTFTLTGTPVRRVEEEEVVLR